METYAFLPGMKSSAHVSKPPQASIFGLPFLRAPSPGDRSALVKGAWSTARLLPGLLLCLCGSANAFNGWEHETISQLSLLVASNYVSVTLGGSLPNANDRLPAMREIASSFYEGLPETAEWRKPSSVAITYGEIVMLVDYMKDPYDMLHLPHSRVPLPIDAKTCNLPYLRSLLERSGSFISLASATHEDYNHFQGRALDSFCSNHKLAVVTASEGNLCGALLLSAYANHLLEDLFAAGHVLTPRDPNSHDLDVALLHDYYNDRGLTYVIEAPQQLTNQANMARAFLRTSPKQWHSQDRKPAHTLALSDDALDSFCDRLAKQPQVGVFCLGDGKMTATNLQPVLMMLYCSRAIADVLESYVRGAATNSFATYVWDRSTFGGFHDVEAVDMRFPYGQLTCRSGVSPIADQRTFQERKGPLTPDTSPTNYNAFASLTTPIFLNPGIAFSFGFESVSDFEGSSVRGLLEAETLVTGERHDISRDLDELRAREFPRNLWPRSWGLTLGYSGMYGVDDTGQGAFGRVIWPIPALNLQISAQVGGRYYWGQGVEGIRDFEMLRVDWGLHIMTIFVGVGHDYYTRDHMGLYSGLAFEAGISFALPYSKLSHPAGLFE
jgi:hypothetical protein